MEWETLTEEHYAIAEANGISRHNVWQRYNEYGWELEDAITRPVKNVGKRNTYNEDAIKRAEAIGVSRETFQKRVRLGWSEEDASTTPITPLHERARRNGKFTPEQIETFTKNGLSRGTVRQRLLMGWDMEEAITLPAFKTGERREGIEHIGNRSFGKPFVK